MNPLVGAAIKMFAADRKRSVILLLQAILLICLMNFVHSCDKDKQNFTHYNLEYVPFGSIRDTVTSLDLQYNNISEIQWFKRYDCIQKIKLGYNLLSYIPDFQNVSDTLNVLDLKNNKITHVRRDRLLFLHLTNLRLGDNLIKVFPDMPSGWGSNLEAIRLEGNELTTLPRIPGLSSTAEVDVGNNNIVCNCKLKESIWRQTKNGKCAEPSQLTTAAGIYINNITSPHIWEYGGKFQHIIRSLSLNACGTKNPESFNIAL